MDNYLEIPIDRDGTHFNHILNYMRDGTLPSALSREVLELLEIEADYYQMNQLKALIQSRLKK